MHMNDLLEVLPIPPGYLINGKLFPRFIPSLDELGYFIVQVMTDIVIPLVDPFIADPFLADQLLQRRVEFLKTSPDILFNLLVIGPVAPFIFHRTNGLSYSLNGRSVLP